MIKKLKIKIIKMIKKRVCKSYFCFVLFSLSSDHTLVLSFLGKEALPKNDPITAYFCSFSSIGVESPREKERIEPCRTS